MKTAAAAYLPPKTFPGATAFHENLQKFPPAGELILFSDADWPNVVKLKASIDQFREGQPGCTFVEGQHASKVNPFALHNTVFLAACKIAREMGVTHMLYVEADCRVGKIGWDKIIFEEYFNLGRPCIVAGTVSIYNPCNSTLKAALRARELLARPHRHGIPTAAYGWFGANDKKTFCAFPNGALAVYDLTWMNQLWDLVEIGMAARQNTAFDMAIGAHLADKFGEEAFDVIGYLETVYSGFGDVLTSPDDRKRMLLDGTICAVHQIKDSWNP